MSHPHFRSGLVPRFAARHGGFTLVELITVIVILGVLAAVALPRFADLGGSARKSKLQAFAGSIKAAAALAKAQAIANGVSCATETGTSVTLEGLTVALNYCYPQALSTAILVAANTGVGDGFTVTEGAVAGNSKLTLQLTAATTPASCKIEYTSPNAGNTQPSIVATDSGC